MPENAREEIEEYFRELVPAERVEQKMRELASVFEAIASSQPLIQQTHTFLKTALEHPELDARLRLDCLCTLCWSKHEEAAALLSETLQEQLSTDWTDTAERLALWQQHQHGPDAAALAQALLWEEIAQLVSNAVHLEPGEAARKLGLLLEVGRVVN